MRASKMSLGSGLRAFLLDVRGSYWFIPGLLALFALLASLVTLGLDRSGAGVFLERYAFWQPSAQGARDQLNAVTTSMITVAATVFAITIAAVSFASGNFGPRVLSNFMRDRGNQLALGVFIASFVYNLMVLRSIRGEMESAQPEFIPHISVATGMVSVLLAVAMLVFFLHHIPASIRINTLVGSIGRRLLRDIAERFPHPGAGEEPKQVESGTPIAAAQAGYIEVIDFKALDTIAREEGVVISLRQRTGDFVHQAVPLANIVGGQLHGEALNRFQRAFSIDDQRSYLQDLEFLFDELAEITLRALSPGINDPYTAVTCIHWMGAAMASLAGRELTRGPEQEDYDRRLVRPISDDFRHFLRRSFGSIRPSAAGSPVAAKVLLDTLVSVADAAASEDRRRAVVEEARILLAQAETELAGPSLQELRDRLTRFESEAAPPQDDVRLDPEL